MKKVKKARTACKGRTCAGCLWQWPSLTAGEEGVYRCYRSCCKNYHKVADRRCELFETRISMQINWVRGEEANDGTAEPG